MDIFKRISILPSYADGFVFVWELSSGFSDPLPWRFVIEEAQTSIGVWNTISPILTNVFAWADNKPRVVSKDHVLSFRVEMTTPCGKYVSSVIEPYSNLNRREYLIAKDIMRREVLQQYGMSGIDAMFYARSVWGTVCTNCVDPITGDSKSSNCGVCYGTGRVPPYHGPYNVWVTFNPQPKNPEIKQDGTGLIQQYDYEARIVGFPPIKDLDILVDKTSDKRYIVDGVTSILEMRMYPVIQTAHIHELPVSDPVYKLGTTKEDEATCEMP